MLSDADVPFVVSRIKGRDGAICKSPDSLVRLLLPTYVVVSQLNSIVVIMCYDPQIPRKSISYLLFFYKHNFRFLLSLRETEGQREREKE